MSANFGLLSSSTSGGGGGGGGAAVVSPPPPGNGGKFVGAKSSFCWFLYLYKNYKEEGMLL